jgi:cell shape-determining protein MreC
MGGTRDYLQAEWELFHEERARNIAREMTSAVEAAKSLTEHLQEHNRLLKENKQLRKELESGQ